MKPQLNQQNDTFCQANNDEIDLVDLFLIIWRRKTMIVMVTLLLIATAVTAVFVLPSIYEITTIIEPGTDAVGKPIGNPQAIRENVLGHAYDKVIAEKLKIPLVEIPKFKVSIPKGTYLLKISLESPDPQQAVTILQTLLTEISDENQQRFQLKKQIMENELAVALAKEDFLTERIGKLEKLIQQAQSKVHELEIARGKEMMDVSKNPVNTLLFLNEIQNQHVFINNLQDDLIEFKENKKETTMNVADLRLKLANIDGMQINKAPTIPTKPTKPKKVFIVALAAILGLMGGIMLAFFSEFIAKVRQQQQVLD